MATNEKRLRELSDSDFEIADGQTDFRGWKVYDNSGKRLGEVEELIFDEKSWKVRYAVLDLDDNEVNIDDKEVLVPIGMVELDGKDDKVLLQGITAEQLRSLPEYDDDTSLDADTERRICSALGRDTAAYTTQQHDESFYQHEHFNDQRPYNNRKLLGMGSQYDKGLNLRNRTNASGSEVEGYLGSDTTPGDYRNRTMSEQRIEEDSAVPVSDPGRDAEQLRRNQELMEGDQLSGDNIRNRLSDEDAERGSTRS